MANRETFPNVLAGRAQYNSTRDVGDWPDTGNAAYLRTQKTAHEGPGQGRNQAGIVTSSGHIRLSAKLLSSPRSPSQPALQV